MKQTCGVHFDLGLPSIPESGKVVKMKKEVETGGDMKIVNLTLEN